MKRIISFVLCVSILLLSCPLINAADFTESVFEDPGRLSDEDFFGVWENGEWIVESKINYDYDEQLKTVEEAVKNGDYYKAKSDLMYYYQNREMEPQMATTRDPLSAIVLNNDVYYSQAPVYDIIEVSETPQWHEIDVTGGVLVGTACYTLHMLERDFCEEGEEGIACFNSREASENTPYLEVEQGGNIYTIPSSGDMYIRGGRYASMNYGKEEQLLVSELGSEKDTGTFPASNGTRQTHIRFNTTFLDPDLPITRATLKLYGSASAPGKRIAAFISTITTTWDEGEITYLLYPNQIISYQGVDGVYDWHSAVASHMQFYNVLCRLDLLKNFFVEARETGNTEYERKALEIFLDYIKDINGLTNDWYASEKRLNAAFRNSGNSQQCFFNALRFSELDPIAFGAMIKFMWQEVEAMSGPLMEGQINLNGLSAIIGSLLRFSTYFPEFANRDHYIEKANNRLFEWIEQCLYEDGSYRESSSGYDAGVLGEISAFYDVVKGSDISIPEEFDEYYRSFAVSQMNLTQPDYEQFRWGDGGRKTDMDSRIYEVAKHLDDDELLYFATGGAEGTLPSYTSYFAPFGKLGVMRSDWTDRGVAAFIIGRIGGSHAHHHMNHINLYAYDRILLRDTGRASYDARHPAVAWQTNRAESHSTVEVNDHGQRISFSDADYDQSSARMTMNTKMDFFSAMSNANPEEAIHTRKLAFVKKHKFYIVTDFMENLNGMENKYNQVWHVNASGNDMMMEDETKTMKTLYDSGANLSIVPVNPSNLSFAGIVANPVGRHLSYYINSDKNAYMSVLLYPFENSAEDVVTREIPVSSNENNTATAFTIELPDDGEGLYFVNNDTTEVHRFDKYDADAGMFYIEKNASGETVMFSADTVNSIAENNLPLLKTNRVLTDVAVSYNDKFVEIECTDDFDPEKDYIMVAAPDRSEIVRFNQDIVPYFRLNDCIVVGTYSENLRYRVDENNAVATLPAMKLEFPGEKGTPCFEIAEGTVIKTDKGWEGKFSISPMKETEEKVGAVTYGVFEFIEGEVDIPIRFYYNGDENHRIAPMVNGEVKKPSTKLSEDSIDTAVNMTDVCAYYSANDLSVVYTKALGDLVYYSESPSDSTDSGENDEKIPGSGHIGGNGSGGGSSSGGSSSGGNSSGGNSSGGGSFGGSGNTGNVGGSTVVEDIENPFKDIVGHWAKDNILQLYKGGIVNGSNDKFEPDRNATRAEVTAMFVRSANLEINNEYKGMFSDVAGDSWYATTVETAAQNNIVSGNGNGFAPMESITRAQLCKIAMNTYSLLGGKLSEKKEFFFADMDNIPSWAEKEIADAVSLGIITGYPDKTFRPDNFATRAEVAVVLGRLTQLLNK